jgi:hypothetical protein
MKESDYKKKKNQVSVFLIIQVTGGLLKELINTTLSAAVNYQF